MDKNDYKVLITEYEKLNIERPEVIARATEHIDIMEEYVKKIIENGFSYQTENTIYFDTSKLDNYYVFGNQNEEDLAVGVRDSVEEDSNKKNKRAIVLHNSLENRIKIC